MNIHVGEIRNRSGSPGMLLTGDLDHLNNLLISLFKRDNSCFVIRVISYCPGMQMNLIPQNDLRHIKAYSLGGTSLKKRRKIKRPLIPNKPTHVVYKSSKALGEMSFYKHKHFIADLLKKKSRKFFIEILEFVNMGNHLHIKVRFKDRKRMGQFLKSFAATLARKITGAKKGKPFGKFWDGLVYTRVLMTSFEELSLRGYFEGSRFSTLTKVFTTKGF